MIDRDKAKVPVQSLIDHIKTAIDVDPWAKEMAEKLLKECQSVENFYGYTYSEMECVLDVMRAIGNETRLDAQERKDFDIALLCITYVMDRMKPQEEEKQ